MERPDNLTDEELVLHAQKRSEAHFNALVDRYTQMVYRLAYGITGRSQDAEDIVQETFLKVFIHLDRFSPSKGTFKSWLLTIARNQSINVFSLLKRNVLRIFNEGDPDQTSLQYSENPLTEHQQDVESLLSAKQEFFKVKQALDQLPERQKTALMLKAQENMSYEEIAAVLKTSVSSVESLIFRARRRLLEIIGK